MKPADPSLPAFAEVLGAPVEDVRLLAGNKYCSIYSAHCRGARVIVKQYHAGDARLAVTEAEGVALYHRIAEGDPRLLDSIPLGASEALRVVGISFVPGERLADALYRWARRREDWPRGFAALALLGEVLRKLRGASLLPGEAMDPFHAEYIRHCSRRLQGAPGVGALLFPRAMEEAEALLQGFLACGEAPSAAHGDFVFRNIHIEEGRLGLIDFANTLRASHPLNDAMNLWFGLQNMPLPRAFAAGLWSAFREGHGAAAYHPAAQRFFHEFHRRRWLMLNLRTRDPRRWARAARALLTHARPASPQGPGLFP